MAAALSGAVLVAPFLLLRTAPATASHPPEGHQPAAAIPSPLAPSQLVHFDQRRPAGPVPAATTTTPSTTSTTSTVPPRPAVASTTAAPTTTTAAPTTTTTTVPPTTTTTTAAPPAPEAAPGEAETGLATWYDEAPPGTCASPTLAFGTVLTVTNVADGASTTCTVEDREADNPGRVVDMSPSGFGQIADLSAGVATVTVSW